MPLLQGASPQRHPVLIQVGGTPRDIGACAHFANLAVGASKTLSDKARASHDFSPKPSPARSEYH
jgi:hypothetical protein